jgi:Xaa-Pro dipeptidase
MLMEARMIKSVDEINLWRIATTIADGAFYAVYEAIKPGVRDVDIRAAAFKYVTTETDGDFFGFNVWSGPNTYDHSLTSTDRLIQVGDIVFVDAVGSSFMGYCNCTYRNFIVGRKPNDREKDWFKRALDKQNRVIDAIRPGATTADVAKYLDPASAFNFPAEHYAFGLDSCHGIGMSTHEAPHISRVFSLEYPQPIEANMCFAVEVLCGELGEGAFRIEDHVLVTEDGPEIVGRFPRDEIVVACPII